MPWPAWLTRTRSLDNVKIIDVQIDGVIKVLHDPNIFLGISPLVLKLKQDASDPMLYEITERLPMLGMIEGSTTFECRVKFLKDGVENEVAAGMGTRLKSCFRARSLGPHQTEVTEHTTVSGISFLMPYIFPTMKEAHLSFMDKIGFEAQKAVGQAAQRLNAFSTNRRPHTASLSLLYPSMFLAFLALSFLSMSFTKSILLIALLLLLMFNQQRMSDPYGLFHLALNTDPGESGSEDPKTEWLNMGFWQDTDIFPGACEALARKLAEAARYRSGSDLLDVGHGTGESLIFLLSDPSLPRLSSLTGVTSLESHYRRSEQRVARLYPSLREPRPQIKLYHGDAVYRPHEAQLDHPFHPKAPVYFDAILALDCAYHFNTRETFLRQSFDRLSHSGRIALADICFSRPSSLGRLMWMTIPRPNIITKEEYAAALEQIGYVDVEMNDITEHVFPGFVKFLRTRGLQWKLFGMGVERLMEAGARFVIVAGSRP